MNGLPGRVSITVLYFILLAGCAGLHSNLDAPITSSVKEKKVAVLPFQDPYYKGRQILGVGEPFATVFVNKLQSTGVSASLIKSTMFTSNEAIDSNKACKYADENGYNAIIIGKVTEWIDGATQWSGKVDVASLSVSVYFTPDCALSGSASGRQNGQWFTFVNAPTTRFFEPLSKKIVEELVNQ